ncbi:MAG: phage gp6-like head-tail connector protein [Planctomycetes bacterium]|nr:phage gp6-like head-tail connector protein [Planctomycetota bacterium]
MTAVPRAAQVGIMMIAAHLWKNRELSTTDALREVPFGAKAMLDTIRFHEYG